MATGGTSIGSLALEVERACGTTLGSQEWGSDDVVGATLDSWAGRVVTVVGIAFGT